MLAALGADPSVFDAVRAAAGALGAVAEVSDAVSPTVTAVYIVPNRTGTATRRFAEKSTDLASMSDFEIRGKSFLLAIFERTGVAGLVIAALALAGALAALAFAVFQALRPFV